MSRFLSPVSCSFVLSVLALTGCASTESAHVNTALADQLTDCAYSSTRYMMHADGLNMQIEKGHATAGYYRAAGIALSDEVHARRRFDAARRKFALSGVPDAGVGASDTATRAAMTAMLPELAACATLSSTHKKVIDPRVAAYLSHSR